MQTLSEPCSVQCECSSVGRAAAGDSWDVQHAGLRSVPWNSSVGYVPKVTTLRCKWTWVCLHQHTGMNTLRLHALLLVAMLSIRCIVMR